MNPWKVVLVEGEVCMELFRNIIVREAETGRIMSA